MAHLSQPYVSLNCPEENDETRSEEFESGRLPDRSQAHTSNNHSTTFPRLREERQIIHQDETVCYNHPQLPQYLSSAYTHQTPYPSWEDTERAGHHVWQDSSSFGLGRRAASPHSLPSCLPSAIYQTLSDTSCLFPSRPHSLPPDSIPSLEHPRSLRSIPPTAHMHPNPASSYSAPYPHPPCCGQCVQPQHHMNPAHHCSPRAEHHLPYRPSGALISNWRFQRLVRYTELDSPFSENGHACPRPKQASPSTTHLSKEQRKVFVTYEADNEEHLKEIIKFVALLRNNGFDTHIDVFEQQLNSISKIDCMERYLNEKDYLIIIIISLKYYETVTGTNLSPETEERTSDTVYIHKQLQSEFIQNGCRNFRFIPILFPGAKKSFVPAWLQNTHIYSWPRDRDDILRRLMRVEKYTPPPIGPLPTIVSVPL